jgi:uncharacterized membrane protein (DUF485 family)
MIDDAALLQADATVIVGILIFLTLAPIGKEEQEFRELMKQRKVFLSTIFTIVTLVLSAIFVLLWSFSAAESAFILGLLGVVVTIVIIMPKPRFTWFHTRH